MCERSQFTTDVKEVEDADDKRGDNETVEDSSVGDQTRDQPDCESGEEQRNDDGVDEVPHVREEHAQLLTELGRFTDE